MVTVATIILLWSTTAITDFASVLQTRTFRTNLVKGEYVYEEVLEPEESVDDELIDVDEEIITDPDEIEEPEPLDEQEPQEPDEHTDVSTTINIKPIIDDDNVELEEPIDPGEDAYDIPDDSGEPIKTDTKEPDETIEEYSEENEKKTNETEVQGP